MNQPDSLFPCFARRHVPVLARPQPRLSWLRAPACLLGFFAVACSSPACIETSSAPDADATTPSEAPADFAAVLHDATDQDTQDALHAAAPWQESSTFGDPRDWGYETDPYQIVSPNPAIPLPTRASPCPAEMVYIPTENPFCIDRWEVVLKDQAHRRTLSPHYSPTSEYARKAFEIWSTKRLQIGNAEARKMQLPPLPPWQLESEPRFVAVSLPDQIPQGYVSGQQAKQACQNAGKQLCTRRQWVRACRGEKNQQFPYGTTYRQGQCNVHRLNHPAFMLHNDPSIGHLDPRLNLVEDAQGPLLRRTGQLKTCASRWGNDAVYDMVGNLDEWIDDNDGVFLGGFYSRARKDGCDASISSHPVQYFDYSLGIRCCRPATPHR